MRADYWLKLFRRFGARWRQFLIVHVVINILVFVVLAPLATVLLNLLVTFSGDIALSDQDIVYFFLRPAGMVSLLFVGSLFSIIIFLEHAALITVAYYGTDDQSVSGLWLLGFLGRKAASLFRLSIRILLSVLLILAPFLLLFLATYYILLGEFDINFYLSEKPPEFYQALIIAGLIAAVMAWLLLRLFISWVFALPFLLLNGLSPTQALAASRRAVKGHRLKIGVLLVIWMIVSVAISALITGLIGVLGTFLVPMAVKSIAVLLLVLSVVAIFSISMNFVLTLFSNSVLGLLILDLFKWLELDRGVTTKPGIRRSLDLDFNLSRGRIAGVIVLAVVLAGIFIYGMLDRVRMEDRTEVMAHRGASGSAPENTLAAIRAAIDAGADWVEIDVQETADGEIVLIHDSDLKKISGKAMKIVDTSLADLQRVDIGSWFDPVFSDQRIPTLKEALKLSKGRIEVNIELKYYGAQRRLEESVARIVDAESMQDQVLIMSLDYNGIKKMRQLRPDWKLGLLSTVALGNVTGLDVDFLALNAQSTSRTKIRHIQERDKLVMVWTVNDAVGMSIMFGRGVDAIITDEPALAVSVLQQRTELNSAQRLLMLLADVFDQTSMYHEQ